MTSRNSVAEGARRFRLTRTLAAVMASVLVFWAVLELTAFKIVESGGRGGLATASALASDNWRYPEALGAAQLEAGAPAPALVYYKESISRYGRCASCWLGLARSQRLTGTNPDAALERALSFASADSSVRLAAAELLSQLGRSEQALAEFVAALGGVRGDLPDMFATIERSFAAQKVLTTIEAVRRDLVGEYFDYSLGVHSPELVAEIWARLDESKRQDARGAYANYLLGHGMFSQAWRVQFGKNHPDLYVLDGDFESEGSGGCFGWNLQAGDGVRTSIERCSHCDSGTKALRLFFDGRHNPNYSGASMLVPVHSGRGYELVFKVRYRELTSAKGPRVEVTGSEAVGDCHFRASSKPFLGSSDWHRVKVQFDVPSGCYGVRIAVARSAGDKPSDLISGELWLDDFALADRAKNSR